MKIVVKKGLDIPIAGGPEGSPQLIRHAPGQIALNLEAFDDIRFKVHVKVGDSVKIGQPLVESKDVPGQMFASPAGGVVAEIRRGFKRRLVAVVINLNKDETFEEYGGLDLKSASKEEILDLFMRSGMFPHIRLRPFNVVPDPKLTPRDIFVAAIETRPFLPSAEMQIAGRETYFQAGLNTLSKLTSGKVHLVYSAKSNCSALTGAENVEKHVVVGPHPAGNSSVHIHSVAPIRRPNDYVWSLSALDTIVIGKMILEGRYFTDRVIALAGNGLLEGKSGFFHARMGYPIRELIAGQLPNIPLSFISGDPLTGIKADSADFLGFYHTCLSVIPLNTHREPFHFFRLGLKKFSATRAYFTGHVKPPKEGYEFTTNQHGEERAFVDGSIYQRVMPMHIPTMQLIKALLSEDFELAQQLGLLEVVPEDFALPAFICPSKIEMIDIVKQGLLRCREE